MYLIYKQGDCRSFNLLYDKNEFVFRKIIPRCSLNRNDTMRIGPQRYLYLFWMTFFYAGFKRVFKEYRIERKDGRLVSRGVVMSYVPVYNFMPRNGIHLGYCTTEKNERGKGFYTLLLKMIQNDLPNYDIYMIVEENNVASIMGIENAGFVRCGKCEKISGIFVSQINEE